MEYSNQTIFGWISPTGDIFDSGNYPAYNHDNLLDKLSVFPPVIEMLGASNKSELNEVFNEMGVSRWALLNNWIRFIGISGYLTNQSSILFEGNKNQIKNKNILDSMSSIIEAYEAEKGPLEEVVIDLLTPGRRHVEDTLKLKPEELTFENINIEKKEAFDDSFDVAGIVDLYSNINKMLLGISAIIVGVERLNAYRLEILQNPITGQVANLLLDAVNDMVYQLHDSFTFGSYKIEASDVDIIQSLTSGYTYYPPRGSLNFQPLFDLILLVANLVKNYYRGRKTFTKREVEDLTRYIIMVIEEIVDGNYKVWWTTFEEMRK